MTSETYSQEFWSEKWKVGSIGFHKDEVHSCLMKYPPQKEKSKIFVPLCGKTLDMKWLSNLGHVVVGVEIVPQAIEDFFKENSLSYTTETKESFIVYKSTSEDHNIHIYCGDLYSYNESYEGQFDFIWDRASLVAISPGDRKKYVSLMAQLLKPRGACLLSSFDYEKDLISPPPNSIPESEIKELYGSKFDIKFLEKENHPKHGDRWIFNYYSLTSKL